MIHGNRPPIQPRWVAIGLAALLLSLVGCAGDGNIARHEEEIRSAIGTYLVEQRGIDPEAMQMEVTQLQVTGDDAKATVVFRTAEMPDGLSFDYQLRRNGGVWEVAASNPQSGHGAPSPESMPEGHPPVAPDDSAPDDTRTDS